MEIRCPKCGRITTDRLTDLLHGKMTKCFASIDPTTGKYVKGCGYDKMNMSEKVFIDFILNGKKPNDTS